MPVTLTILGLIVFVNFKIKAKKEIHLLTDRILRFDKSEY